MGCRFYQFFNVKKKEKNKTRELFSQSCVLGGKQRSQKERVTGDLAEVPLRHPHVILADSDGENMFLLMSNSQSSSSSGRATRESVWLCASPTKSSAKFCLWNPGGWRWNEKEDRDSLIFRSQLEAVGLRVRGIISELVNGEKDDTDVTGMV